MDVLATTDPAEVLRRADALLSADPVRTNVVGTLLRQRAASGDAGRYWVARPDDPIGVGFQSPLNFSVSVTPMPDDAVEAIVDAAFDAGVVFPGVTGDAATASRFAGAWTERTRSAASPESGQRIYEVDEVCPPTGVPGALRVAGPGDRDLLIDWLGWFAEDTGEPVDPLTTVDRRLPLGELYVWTDDRHEQPVSMAAPTPAVAGVARVQAVYTPRHRRGRGYASACVAAVSASARAAGDRCILYTDLANPTSNAIYRALGYRAAAEVLRYRFAVARKS